MSKSYGNTIEIFNTNLKKTRKSFMKIVTDSKTPDEPKDPDNCSIFALYKLFASDKQIEEMADRYRAGGLMYGVAKQELFDIFCEYFASMRKRREELASDMGYVQSVLKKGAEKASEVASQTMSDIRKKVGFWS